MLHAFRATYGQIPFDPEESRGRRENRDTELNHHRDRRPRTESLIQDDEFLEELVDRRDTTGTGAKSSREDKPRHRNQALSSARIRTANLNALIVTTTSHEEDRGSETTTVGLTTHQTGTTTLTGTQPATTSITETAATAEVSSSMVPPTAGTTLVTDRRCRMGRPRTETPTTPAITKEDRATRQSGKTNLQSCQNKGAVARAEP
ncbi:uncharacterized protein MELLADRAFT_105066 [Melampsora larici-populina 98AG31]|uniref:Uncharacterized protein n=1 Tax=Melampsora larici-populina (strain 98AG31 / pathotype 3-4-7) TaxID=747676 RepID=F4RH51_MELLP|nr:uncharacterized protein MELLADRAFT_105066 [Melampsora larici-populina 98AG31]EGG08394.1 hypothetical protein MELLADRAFT_105066 [Melampsora larici-populina 98AG31]